jgi:hypothetical protein
MELEKLTTKNIIVTIIITYIISAFINNKINILNFNEIERVSFIISLTMALLLRTLFKQLK